MAHRSSLFTRTRTRGPRWRCTASCERTRPRERSTGPPSHPTAKVIEGLLPITRAKGQDMGKTGKTRRTEAKVSDRGWPVLATTEELLRVDRSRTIRSASGHDVVIAESRASDGTETRDVMILPPSRRKRGAPSSLWYTLHLPAVASPWRHAAYVWAAFALCCLFWSGDANDRDPVSAVVATVLFGIVALPFLLSGARIVFSFGEFRPGCVPEETRSIYAPVTTTPEGVRRLAHADELRSLCNALDSGSVARVDLALRTFKKEEGRRRFRTEPSLGTIATCVTVISGLVAIFQRNRSDSGETTPAATEFNEVLLVVGVLLFLGTCAFLVTAYSSRRRDYWNDPIWPEAPSAVLVPATRGSESKSADHQGPQPRRRSRGSRWWKPGLRNNVSNARATRWQSAHSAELEGVARQSKNSARASRDPRTGTSPTRHLDPPE